VLTGARPTMPFGLSPQAKAVLRNPTTEGALALLTPEMRASVIHPLVPLASIHKARLKWPGSTKQMVRESKAWLREHGFGTDPNGPSADVPMAHVRVRRQ